MAICAKYADQQTLLAITEGLHNDNEITHLFLEILNSNNIESKETLLNGGFGLSIMLHQMTGWHRYSVKISTASWMLH